VRRNIGRGNPSLLEETDDTQNSAADFFFTNLPAPRNNANLTGTPPASTCGNTMLEGLEQCDDGNTTGGDGCDPTCQVEPMKGDMNEDGELTPSDIVFLLSCVFSGTGICELSFADVNCNAALDPSDIVFELLAVFAGEPLSACP
jgi:cysteine-rich repeat protein